MEGSLIVQTATGTSLINLPTTASSTFLLLRVTRYSSMIKLDLASLPCKFSCHSHCATVL